ncbi:alpha/beta fold hydrolase [Brachybacterium phenoliresistens]|uniref:Alpha/beta hydrolase n=1 Tax=Brachybacterium phenoliresistens TaxID=396014 RepID=Z9JRY1_9MICO|nr:alpha/beta hydrolase [Brachybacterium phenoliresistens]EWS80536.1 alpha/beta hydrolase [Brachybacterium phenoliresistens]
MTRSVVLVHAVRSSRSMWKGQIRRLRRKGYHVEAPNLPGHGTRTAETFTREGSFATIDAAVAACPEPPVLVGLSLGGYLTIHWAAMNPGRIAALVAAGCTVVPGPALARIYGLWLRMKDWMPGDTDARVHRAFARANSPKAAQRYYGGGRAHGVVPGVVRVVGDMDMLADIAAIDVPITFVNGASDPFRRHEGACVAAAGRAELRILEDAGHIVNLNRPKRFTRVLREAAAAVREPA